jgi:NADH pyrophosphatase NudC (nudix superfamily)
VAQSIEMGEEDMSYEERFCGQCGKIMSHREGDDPCLSCEAKNDAENDVDKEAEYLAEIGNEE